MTATLAQDSPSQGLSPSPWHNKYTPQPHKTHLLLLSTYCPICLRKALALCSFTRTVWPRCLQTGRGRAGQVGGRAGGQQRWHSQNGHAGEGRELPNTPPGRQVYALPGRQLHAAHAMPTHLVAELRTASRRCRVTPPERTRSLPSTDSSTACGEETRKA